MKTPAIGPAPIDLPFAGRGGRLAATWRGAVVRRLAALRSGCLQINENGSSQTLGSGVETVAITVRDARFWGEVALGGGLGAAEAYLLGYWDSDDLVGVIRLLARERAVLLGLGGGWSWLVGPLRRLAHAAHRNTRDGARRNIRAHYDLGDEFFRLFLDETMTYSAAWFERPDDDLATAQTAKLDRICRKLALRADDHLVEIGSGWGSLALHAAGTYGCRVTTTTISANQYQRARARVAAAGLENRITVLERDYRDLDGRFTKAASIEMVEAIGHRQYETYFQTIARLLADDGLACIQAITIAEQFYERAKDSVDFIKRHVFPGSCIPSVPALSQAVAQASDLRLLDLEDLTPHYAETLRRWRLAFEDRREEVLAQGFDQGFCRLWRFYLAYCEGGFAERTIGDVHLLLAKPGYTGAVPGTPSPYVGNAT